MIDIVAAIEKSIKDKIKRIPCKSNRASSVGYYVPQLGGCLRRGVLERTKWMEKDLPDVRLQMIFEEGHREEKAVMRMLADAGIDVIEQQSCGEWEKYEITYHLDGIVVDDGVAVPIEIKSMNPFIYDAIHCLEDFRKKPWTTAYLAQIQLYLLGKNVDRGLFILKNKSSGGIKVIEVKLDYELAEACIKACEIINAHVKAGTLPERITDVEVCKNCSMKTVCAPGMNFGVELTIADDPGFQKRLDEVVDLKPFQEQYKKVYDVVSDRVKATAHGGPIKLMVGPYEITGKPDSRGAFRFNIEKL